MLLMWVMLLSVIIVLIKMGVVVVVKGTLMGVTAPKVITNRGEIIGLMGWLVVTRARARNGHSNGHCRIWMVLVLLGVVRVIVGVDLLGMPLSQGRVKARRRAQSWLDGNDRHLRRKGVWVMAKKGWERVGLKAGGWKKREKR